MQFLIKLLLNKKSLTWIASAIAISAVTWGLYDFVYDRGVSAENARWVEIERQRGIERDKAVKAAQAASEQATRRLNELRLDQMAQADRLEALRNENDRLRILSQEPSGRIVESDSGSCFVYDGDRLARLLNEQSYPGSSAVRPADETSLVTMRTETHSDNAP